ncbi:MAG: hypothetical protein FWE90_09040 [Defluviitaleaceae bacterium]|nr:hypothetical protein [Defluviitaleaceae bacterium]
MFKLKKRDRINNIVPFPSAHVLMDTILNGDLDKDIPPVRAEIIKTFNQGETAIHIALLQEGTKREQEVTKRGQEETKRKAEKEKTKQELYKCLATLVEKLLGISKICVVFFIFISVFMVISLVYLGVNNETTGNIENIEASVASSDLHGAITGWIQIVLMIVQIIIPFFL